MQEESIPTVKKDSFNLIKGNFSPDEASEIVHDLFSKKIHFNELKSFSQLVRFGAIDPKLQKRIEELKLSREEAKRILAGAGEGGKQLKVTSTIEIEIL